MLKILITDKISEKGIEYLKSLDDVKPVVRADIDENELAAIIGEYDGLIIRSGTQVNAEVLENAGKLRAIVRAGVGVDNIDIDAATKKGIFVMNTPGANTLSAAEHTMALVMAMSRNIVPACNSLKSGKWDRKQFTGRQLDDKTLGLIGLGRIGMAVAKIAKGLNMRIIGYDPLAKESEVEKAGIDLTTDFNEIIKKSDYISLHVPKNKQTTNMIDKAQFDMMKPTAHIVNCSRGGVVNEDALYDALEKDEIAGAALDVFNEEPPENTRFENLDNCLVTPHLGASTEEAQIEVAREAARVLIDTLKGKAIKNTLNAPTRAGSIPLIVRSYSELAKRIGMMASVLAGGRIKDVQVQYRGKIVDQDVELITNSFQIGLLRGYFDTPVNMVNAPLLAEERDINIEEKKRSEPHDFASEFGARITTRSGVTRITGTVLSENIMRIIEINGFGIEMSPADTVVIIFNDDQPGVIGQVGTALGKHGMNIETMGVGQKLKEKEAVLAFSVDKEPSEEVIKEIEALHFVNNVYVCRLD